MRRDGGETPGAALFRLCWFFGISRFSGKLGPAFTQDNLKVPGISRKHLLVMEGDDNATAAFRVPAKPRSSNETTQEAPDPPVKDKGKDKVVEPENDENSNGESPQRAPVAQDATPPPFTPAYRLPPWDPSGARYDYQLEILKGGVIIKTLPISEKGHYLFGRHPQCDVPTEHPVNHEIDLNNSKLIIIHVFITPIESIATACNYPTQR